MSDSKKFTGFVPPKSNYYKTPNEWIDLCASIDSLAELKVIQYVLRHTWGYQEYGIYKHITTDEFMYGRKRADGKRMDKGTGLSDWGVKDGIKRAVADGYLICIVDERDLARIKKSYALNMLAESDEEDEGSNPPIELEGSNPPIGQRNSPSKKRNSPIGGRQSSHRTEEEPRERHSKKDTKGKETPTSQKPQQESSSSADIDLFVSHFKQATSTYKFLSSQYRLPSKNKPEWQLLGEIAAKHRTLEEVSEQVALFWNDQNRDGTYYWQEDNHLTITSFARNHANQVEKMAHLLQPEPQQEAVEEYGYDIPSVELPEACQAFFMSLYEVWEQKTYEYDLPSIAGNYYKSNMTEGEFLEMVNDIKADIEQQNVKLFLRLHKFNLALETEIKRQNYTQAKQA